MVFQTSKESMSFHYLHPSSRWGSQSWTQAGLYCKETKLALPMSASALGLQWETPPSEGSSTGSPRTSVKYILKLHGHPDGAVLQVTAVFHWDILFVSNGERNNEVFEILTGLHTELAVEVNLLVAKDRFKEESWYLRQGL